MTIEGLSWTNLWLGILAVLSLIEFLMIAAVGFFAYRTYRKTMAVIETIEQRHVLPLRAKVEAIINEAQIVAGRVKDAEESVADALKHAASAGSVIVGSVRSKAWPILGLVRGVRVAVSAMLNGRSGHGEPLRTHPETHQARAGLP